MEKRRQFSGASERPVSEKMKRALLAVDLRDCKPIVCASSLGECAARHNVSRAAIVSD